MVVFGTNEKAAVAFSPTFQWEDSPDDLFPRQTTLSFVLDAKIPGRSAGAHIQETDLVLPSLVRLKMEIQIFDCFRGCFWMMWKHKYS